MQQNLCEGKLINGVGFNVFTCINEFVYTNPLLWQDYWLFYPSVHSLSPDNAGKRKRKKQHEDAAHKSKIKASWGPLKVWGHRGSIQCSLPPPPLGGPECFSWHTTNFFLEILYHSQGDKNILLQTVHMLYIYWCSSNSCHWSNVVQNTISISSLHLQLL